jgi:hypothetical protein
MRKQKTSARLAAAGLICFAITVAGCAHLVDRPAPATVAPAAASADAIASDKPQIAKPVLHSGDVWVDRIEGNDREFRIEDVHDGTMDVSFWGAEMTTDDAFNAIVYRSLTQSASEPIKSNKPGMWFDFPLYPGKTWEDNYNWEQLGAAPAKGKAEDRGSVLGWENVTVPAGTFHALKVVVKSRYYGAGGFNDDSTLTFWWAAEVNRFVKFDYRDIYDGALLAEMVSYKPSAPPN